jgi:peptidoglycan/LPS O-acetylase OafA/YrhL
VNQQLPRVFYPALTGLRFVAASMVFIFHYQDAIVPHVPVWLARLTGEFHTGVALFFVLSGFLITYQYQHYTFSHAGNYVRYLLIRSGRIFPLYIPIFLEMHSRWLYFVPEFMLHLSLLKGFFKKIHLSGVVQAWTLTVELTFYVLAPFLIWLGKKKSLLVPYILTLLTGILLTGIGFGLSKWGYNPYGFMPDLAFSAWNTFFGRATEFFAGIGLGFYIGSEAKYKPITFPFSGFFTCSGLLLFGMLLFIISAGGGGGEAGSTKGYGLVLHNLFLPIGIIILLFGLMHEKTWVSKILSSQLFILLGNASYAFYLLHLGRAESFIAVLTQNNILLNFLILWFLSILVYLFWEKPIYKFVKSKAKNFRF